MYRLAIVLGSGNAALGIMLGAFAAHALQHTLTVKMLSVFNTATDYHLYHSLGLIVLGLLIKQRPSCAWLKNSMYLMLTGIVVFCGSLYTLSITGQTKLGMITPIGGVAFILAWIFILISYFRSINSGP